MEKDWIGKNCKGCDYRVDRFCRRFPQQYKVAEHAYVRNTVAKPMFELIEFAEACSEYKAV